MKNECEKKTCFQNWKLLTIAGGAGCGNTGRPFWWQESLSVNSFWLSGLESWKKITLYHGLQFVQGHFSHCSQGLFRSQNCLRHTPDPLLSPSGNVYGLTLCKSFRIGETGKTEQICAQWCQGIHFKDRIGSFSFTWTWNKKRTLARVFRVIGQSQKQICIQSTL